MAAPQVYLIDVITKIVDGHPNSCIGELLPWASDFRRILISRMNWIHECHLGLTGLS